MQVETFIDQLHAKLQLKNTPLNEKGSILINSIKNNLNVEQRTNPTAYLAQLINLLKTIKEGQDVIIFLINKVLPSAPIAVVRKLIPAILEELSKIQLDNVSLAVCGQVLALYQELANPKMQQLFVIVLQSTISDKKKMRKQAIKTLQTFYQQRALELQQYPQYNEALLNHLKQNLEENNECAQHTITLLASLNNLIPYSIVADALYVIIEEIQNLDSKYYPYVFLSLEQVLNQNIGADQAEKLLQQLNQLQPEEINAQHAYIQCLRQCLINLSQSSLSIAASYLPSTISNMSELLLQNNQKLMQHCKFEIMTLIEKIGKATLQIKQDLAEDIMNLELESGGSLQQKYMAILTYLFSNRFDHANILDVFAKFFATIDDSTYEHCKQLIVEFVHNKSRWPHVYFEKTFGQLCQSVSMSLLLKTFPLKTEGIDPLDKDFDEKSNCWILYILSKFAQPKLDEFLDYLFPLTNLLNLVSNANINHEQKILQNILFHVLDIASNSKTTSESQKHPKLQAFIDLILQQLNKGHVFYEKFLLLIAKLYSQMITYPQLQSAAKQYISNLAKQVEQNNCTHTLNAIKVLSFAAPPQYTQEALKKNMEKLLQTKDKLDEKSLNNMDIVLQVVCSQKITSDLWEYCIGFCKQMINIPIIQKKIYKFLNVIMPKVHHTFLNEAYQLLLESECEPSSRQKRFQAIIQLEQCGTKSLEDFQTFIQQFLPEMIVAIRDNNIKTRWLAEKLIENIGQRLHGMEMLEQFISMVFAGLAGQSNVMKADAIATVSLLIDKFHQNLKSEFVEEITRLILLLLKEHNNEIYKAILSLIKVLIKHRLSLNQQIFIQLLNEDVVSRDKNIIILKRILMKLSKAFTTAEEMIPTEHIKLYKNAIKIDKQQKKKKNQRDQERLKNKEKLKEKKIKQKKQDSDEESNNEDVEEEVAPAPKGGMETEEATENNLLLKYDFKKEQFHFEDVVRQKKKQAEQSKQPTTQPIVEYKDGKVVVHEPKEVLGQKRRRENQDSDDEAQTQKRITKNDRKTQSVHVIKESGATFKSKQKAGGDVTVKGRPEPFAFIQLNPKALNKRFKNQASKAFEEVFQKKSGGLKGVRSHK